MSIMKTIRENKIFTGLLFAGTMLASCSKGGEATPSNNNGGGTGVTPPVNPPVTGYTTVDKKDLNTVGFAFYYDGVSKTVTGTQSTAATTVGIQTSAGGDIPVDIKLADSDIEKVEVDKDGEWVDATLKKGASPMATYKNVKEEATKTIFKEVNANFNSNPNATGHIIVYAANASTTFPKNGTYNAAFFSNFKSSTQNVAKFNYTPK